MRLPHADPIGGPANGEPSPTGHPRIPWCHAFAASMPARLTAVFGQWECAPGSRTAKLASWFCEEHDARRNR
jgi:hypothetical protein